MAPLEENQPHFIFNQIKWDWLKCLYGAFRHELLRAPATEPRETLISYFSLCIKWNLVMHEQLVFSLNVLTLWSPFKFGVNYIIAFHFSFNIYWILQFTLHLAAYTQKHKILKKAWSPIDHHPHFASTRMHKCILARAIHPLPWPYKAQLCFWKNAAFVYVTTICFISLSIRPTVMKKRYLQLHNLTASWAWCLNEHFQHLQKP